MPQVRNSPSGELVFVPGNTIVADLASLAALPDSGAVSDLVWVDTLLCYWHRNRFSLLASDGITVLPAIGGGNWERIVSTTAPDWCSQASWGVDPVLGDDENVGTPASPLATFDELNRRLSTAALRQDTTVTIPAGAAISDVVLNLDFGTFLFSIIGTPTVVATDVVNTYTDRVHATPIASQLTSVGIADFTPYAGMRVRITSGASAGAIAWITRSNPGGVGVATARTSRFATKATLISSPAAAVPLAGSSFVIESLPTIAKLTLRERTSGVFNVPGVQSLLSSIQFGAGSASNLVTVVDFSVIVDGCKVNVARNGSNTTSHVNFNIDRSCLYAPAAGGTSVVRLCTVRYGAAFSAGISLAMFNTLNSVLVDGYTGTNGGITLDSGNPFPNGESLDDVQVFDCTNGVALLSPCNIVSRNGLSGNGNTIGILVNSTTANVRTNGQSFVWRSAADLPNLLGATTPIRIAGTTNIDLTWAKLPFYDDEQSGLGTLVNGTATILARNANQRDPVATHATLAGAAVGTLAIPVATRTATQFVVNSYTAAGVLAADNSTFSWHIPGMARNIVMCEGGSLVDSV